MALGMRQKYMDFIHFMKLQYRELIRAVLNRTKGLPWEERITKFKSTASIYTMMK
jgi:hypothetical protein